jgi:predicted ester cyclase
MVAAFDTGNVDDISAFVDANYLDHQGLDGEEIHGPDGFARVVRVARSGYDDLTVTVQELIEEGNRAAARVQWRGTRAAGDVAERETIEIVHVNAGRAVEHWGGRS